MTAPPTFEIREGDAVDVLRHVPAAIAQACVTSPPYFGLRDYGHDGQIGMEDTVGAYVERLVEVFEEVRRVLRPDGTLWLNLGDSYANDQKWGGATSGRHPAAIQATQPGYRRRRSTGLKPKDLIGVPWRVAFALQDAGWWLRKAIVWDKPNPMPESIADRPTSSHELVFLLAPSAEYFYDVHGYREPTTSLTPSGNSYARPERVAHNGMGDRGSADRWQLQATRQMRDVWRIPTVPFPGAHFAVFPPELPRRCIRLGTSPYACADCGAPRIRLVERDILPARVAALVPEVTEAGNGRNGRDSDSFGNRITTRTIGWRPSCACGAPAGVQPGDLDVIASPSDHEDDFAEPDPSLFVGRAGLARPRRAEPPREMTRFEQRAIAQQLRHLPEDVRDTLAAEVGREAWAHYLRTDRAGARPVPPGILERWTAAGHVQAVEPPAAWWEADDTARGLVLDPFAGAGTTGLVAVEEGRDFLGVELSPEYAELARERIAPSANALRLDLGI